MDSSSGEGFDSHGAPLLALLSPSLTVASNDTLRAKGPAQVMSLSPDYNWAFT